MSRLHRAGNPHGKQLTCPVTTTTKIVKKVPLAKFFKPRTILMPTIHQRDLKALKIGEEKEKEEEEEGEEGEEE